jgi:peptide chain release factor subunit 1
MPDGRPDSLLQRLVAIQPGSARVVSCYVRLSPEDRQRQKYLTDVKRRMAAVREEGAARDLARIADSLAKVRTLPRTRGLAIFASEELGLFETVPLPRVHRTRVVVDDTPWVRELVAVEQEFGTVLAAVFDRAHARFFAVGPFGGGELAGLVDPSRRGGKFHLDRRDSPGWGERSYHTRLREERHRHVEAIAHHLDGLVGTHPSARILLGGPRKEVTELERCLPPRLARLVIGSPALNPTAVTVAEVQDAAFAAASEDEKARTASLLADFTEALGSGWAVNGPRETLRRLARGQVRTLLIREGAEMGGFRCSIGQVLVLTGADCRGLGAPAPVLDVVDEAVEEALRQRIQIVVLDTGAAARRVDDLAAFLRFR